MLQELFLIAAQTIYKKCTSKYVTTLCTKNEWENRKQETFLFCLMGKRRKEKEYNVKELKVQTKGYQSFFFSVIHTHIHEKRTREKKIS
jgi:hypothetical protein